MKKPIGQLKTETMAYCTICNVSRKRKISANVYENIPAEIEKAKQEIKEKSAKKYTCRICKSIERDINS